MKNLIFPLLLFIFVGGSCTDKPIESKKNVDSQEQQVPTRVKTELVTPTTGEGIQTYVGIVEECEATAVSFTSMGVVKRLLVDEGQNVSKGQLIAEMDDTQARNMLAGAEAQMTQANDALQRYGQLHENGSLPEVQWVEVQSKVAQAQALEQQRQTLEAQHNAAIAAKDQEIANLQAELNALKKAQAQLEVAKKNLADCKLVAPVSGIVGKKQVGAGETALPSQAVVSILNINKVKVKVAIPEAEISEISTNTPSNIKVDAINQQFKGGSIEKGVQADALTHSYEIRINVTNPGHQLLPGMVASVTFNLLSQQATDTKQLTLPVTAVQKKASGKLFVWSVDEYNKAHRTDVTIGATMGNRIVITSGLNAGQRIVTEGYQKLSEGTKVIY